MSVEQVKQVDVSQKPLSKERQFCVQNKMGIHARPAAMLVRVANLYNDVELHVEKEGEERINGKSIMGLMMLAAGFGTKLRFIAVGPRCEALLNEVETLFDRKFEEA